MSPHFKYTFGPVPSRRLGRSLGIDLIPRKTCTYDCVYCQIGRTTCLTAKRSEYNPVDEVLRELEQKLDSGAAPDVITFSGSGEPTLHKSLGEMIRAVKKNSGIPVVVLTNGSLLNLPEVRETLLAADIVCPNLDAGDEQTFAMVDRPAPGIRFEDTVEGLISFGREFTGKLLLEVFILGGMNAADADVKRMGAIAAQVNNATIQLNTVARPPAESFAVGVPPERLQELSLLFSPAAEVIADFKARPESPASGVAPDSILELVARHPCTSIDLAQGLSVSPAEVETVVRALLASGKLRVAPRGGLVYFEPAAD